MSANFNYNTSKLLTIFSSQYLINTDNSQYVCLQRNNSATQQLDKLLDCGANGYIFVPFSVPSSETFPETVKNYGIHDMDSSTINDCLTNMKTFAVNVKNRLIALGQSNNVNFWIGLPQISHSNKTTATNLSGYKTKMNNYIIQAKSIFSSSPNIWSNIKGFYFNQECIYEAEFNPSSPNSIPQGELLQYTSDIVHNSTYNKDLIWIPYIHAYSPTGEPDIGNYDSPNAAMAEEIKNIGMIAGKTNIFDCAYIQAYLTKLYSTWGNVGTVQYPEGVAYSNTVNQNRVTSGTQNINAIFKSVQDNIMYYKNFVPVTTPTSNCVLGAEYELNGDREFTSINTSTGSEQIYNIEGKSLFKKYLKYDSLVGNKPTALYWQSVNSTQFNEMCNIISERYKGTEYSPKSYSVTSAVTSLADAVSSAYSAFILAMDTIFAQPSNTNAQITFNSPLPAYSANTFAKATKAMFFAEYPKKIWAKNINTSFTYINNNQYVSKISYTVTPITGSSSTHVTTFNNAVTSVLNSLGITTVSLNSGSDPESTNTVVSEKYVKENLRTALTDFEKFQKIYMWLINNVTTIDIDDEDHVD